MPTIQCLAVAIAILGWMFSAANYASAVEGWRAGPDEAPTRPVGRRAARRAFFAMSAEALADFIGNSFSQIPNAPAVAGHNLWHTPLPGMFVVLEIGIVGFAFAARKIEREHARLDEITGG